MEDMDSKIAGIFITGMLSWIPQATNSFLEMLSSAQTINGLIKKMRRNINKLCFRMCNECIGKITLMNATLGLPGSASVMK